jgi:hypothetical protein
MKLSLRIGAAALVAGFVIGAAPAQDAAASRDIADEIINQPLPASFSVYNAPRPARLIDDKAVKGGKALRVVIPGAGAHPWDISLADPIAKAVKAGDRLVLAFYAKAEPGDAGAATAHIANASVQLAKAPYTGLFGAPVDIGADWKLYNVAQGVADRDYAGGELNVSLQLATGRQVIDIGPIFVLDLGPQ